MSFIVTIIVKIREKRLKWQNSKFPTRLCRFLDDTIHVLVQKSGKGDRLTRFHSIPINIIACSCILVYRALSHIGASTTESQEAQY